MLSRNTGKTQAKLEGGRLHWDCRATHLQTRPSGRQPGSPERWLGTGKPYSVILQTNCQITIGSLVAFQIQVDQQLFHANVIRSFVTFLTHPSPLRQLKSAKKCKKCQIKSGGRSGSKWLKSS